MIEQNKNITLRAMNNLTVTKSIYLIDASYKLPLQAQKLVLACIAKIDSRHEIPKEITITAAEYGELMQIATPRRDLYTAADALFKSSILIKDDKEETELYWIQKKVKKNKGEGSVTLTWSDDVVRYISQLQSRFTSYKLRNIAQLQSTHSIRLYELLAKFADTGLRVISLDEFKAALGISDKYAQYKILNRDVIKPSVEELNKRSDLLIRYNSVKRGRNVVAIEFEFRHDSQLKMDI